MRKKSGAAPPTHDPFSLRLDEGMKERLSAAAKKLGLGRQTLAQEAIHAAVVAIEAHGGKLVLPVEFRLEPTHVPTPKPIKGPVIYPQRTGEHHTLNQSEDDPYHT